MDRAGSTSELGRNGEGGEDGRVEGRWTENIRDGEE